MAARGTEDFFRQVYRQLNFTFSKYRAAKNYGMKGCLRCSDLLPCLGRVPEHLQQPGGRICYEAHLKGGNLEISYPSTHNLASEIPWSTPSSVACCRTLPSALPEIIARENFVAVCNQLSRRLLKDCVRSHGEVGR